MQDEKKRIVPDTSVIIEGLISKKIIEKEIAPEEVIIHEAVLAELEHQANQGRAIGYLGLDELKKLKEISAEHNFNIKYAGTRPRAVDIKYASMGEIDSLIRSLAFEEDAMLITSDKVQSKVAEARGMKVVYIKPEDMTLKKIELDKFFDKTTMSVHLKEDVTPFAKKGLPGKWQFVTLRKEVMKQDEIKDLSREIIETAKMRRDSFIEIEREGSTIVQLSHYRIVITKPPFSDGWEITAVKPIKKLNLEDYNLSEKLKQRVAEQAEGILIAGAPGMGKSTCAQALAEHFAANGKIVKTVEAPRDLILSDAITQYALSHGDAQEIHDILLLSRPDYTIFDEMRNKSDFDLFADLRLAGIGFIGVVHATNPIDAIQRFIGKIELGVIPQIIDTVVFIKFGQIDKVLSLKMVVKVPSGMMEADLARPVVEVRDFETMKLEFEIYPYGEETMVIPVTAKSEITPMRGLAAKQIEKELLNYADNVEIEGISDHKVIVKVPRKQVAQLIGKQGKRINEIEKKLGISIDVREIEEKDIQKKEMKYSVKEHGGTLLFNVDPHFVGNLADIYIDDEFIFSATVSKKGEIKVHKRSDMGQRLIKALNLNKNISVRT